jgi:hypothetical protein
VRVDERPEVKEFVIEPTHASDDEHHSEADHHTVASSRTLLRSALVGLSFIMMELLLCEKAATPSALRRNEEAIHNDGTKNGASNEHTPIVED